MRKIRRNPLDNFMAKVIKKIDIALWLQGYILNLMKMLNTGEFSKGIIGPSSGVRRGFYGDPFSSNFTIKLATGEHNVNYEIANYSGRPYPHSDFRNFQTNYIRNNYIIEDGPEFLLVIPHKFFSQTHIRNVIANFFEVSNDLLLTDANTLVVNMINENEETLKEAKEIIEDLQTPENYEIKQKVDLEEWNDIRRKFAKDIDSGETLEFPRKVNLSNYIKELSYLAIDFASSIADDDHVRRMQNLIIDIEDIDNFISHGEMVRIIDILEASAPARIIVDYF